MRFGKGGTNGTNVTFLIEFAGNDNALIAEKDKVIEIRARLYDADGKRQGFTLNQENNIKWKWFKETNNKSYMSLKGKTNSSNELISSSI